MHSLSSCCLNMAVCKGKEEAEVSSARNFESICVFGGSQLGKDSEFIQVANELGRVLTARKIHLVYGGGFQGLRGCAAASALIQGNKVLGIATKEQAEKQASVFTLGTELRVSSRSERLGYMLYNADAFIALPGGLGTLEQISAMASLGDSGFHKKPLGLLNINGFYDGLLSFLDHAVEQGFIHRTKRRTFISASNVEQLLDQMQSFKPEPRSYVKKEPLQPDAKTKKRILDTTLRL